MRKILIIEDDQSIAELEKDYLAISGMEADICTDGREGLIKALNNDYDLILLDIMLPEIDGITILKEIREHIDKPVLLVSAKKEEIDKIRGLGAGADDYISKPFSPGELVARIKAHLANYDRLTNGNQTRKQKDIITIRNLTIDKSARRVFVNGEEVMLCAKEYEILLYLASNPNRLFSKEEIFNKVWGMSSFGDNSTVTVHIARIREKIECDPQNPQFIETVWGAGYRFKV